MSHRETNFPQIAQVLVLEHWRLMAFHSPTPQLCLHLLSDLKIFEDTKDNKNLRIYLALWEKKRHYKSASARGWWGSLTLQEIRCRCFFPGTSLSFRWMHLFPLFFRGLGPGRKLGSEGGWFGLINLRNGLKYLMVSGSRKHGKKSIGLSE